MDCEICKAIKEDTNTIENKVLYESNRFVLLPTIGPLEAGHAMLASKEHFLSLSEMGEEAISEFIQVINNLSIKYDFFDNVLISEHGSQDHQLGGACIAHTHIHLIPNYGQDFNILDEILPVTNVNSISELVSVKSPYILSMNMNGDFKVYEAYNAHSQMMRKAICKRYERNDYDWKLDARLDLIGQTVDKWK